LVSLSRLVSRPIFASLGLEDFRYGIFSFFFIYLFMTRHEVHSVNTHTLQDAGRYKQIKENVVQGIGAGRITITVQTLFATALKTEP